MTEKKKLLLFGANKSLMNDFFVQMDMRFEMLSCSRRFKDLQGHLNYYDPDALVLCLYDENKEELSQLNMIKELLKERGSALIVAGDGTKCDEFERIMPNVADLIVRRSRTVTCRLMGEQIVYYLDTRKTPRIIKKEQQPGLTADEAAVADNMSAVGKEPMGGSAASVKTTGNDSLDDILAAAAEAVNEMAAMPVQPRKPGERRHVLVVDDDSSMLRMIKDILGDHYDVAAAISGKVALKFLESRRTDIILLDYEMPGQSGAEVYEKILQNPALRHIPVVFLTGVSDRERISAVLAMRPRGYLLKPIDSERLKKTVAEIVG